MEILHKELSYKIIGCCMDIHRQYGNFHKEKIYHNLLSEQFDLKSIPYKSQPKIPVYSRATGKKIGLYIPDFSIGGSIVLELKTQPFITKKDEIQLLEYLKTSPHEVAYLINFGTPSLEYKRIIFTNDRKPFLSEVKST